MTTQQTLTEAIQAISEDIISWRRHLHQYPEASLKEVETSKYIQNQLKAWGIPFQRVGETGTIAALTGTKGAGKTIVLRADIDALELPDKTGAVYQSKNEGLNHACGHDGHTAALLGALKVLKDHRHTFPGTIKFAFQQAEEIGAGAKHFVQGDFLNDADQVFGIHLASYLPVGQLAATPGAVNASCDIFYITVSGFSSHVSQPHVGRDALLAAASIVVELQKIVAREIDPFDPAVVGIGRLDAGTRYNIVANRARIEGTIRAFSHDTRAFLLKRVEEIANEVAAAHRTTLSFRVHDAAAPLINHSEPAQRARNVAATIVGADNVVTDQQKSMGADDFADFLAAAPGVYGLVGSRNPDEPRTHFGHHHEQFDIDERSLVLAATYHTLYAIDYLTQSS
ncbi:amidohydrolase [Vagococcus acidifermentans]|uniref:Peptidase M20 n=1 Tax=Vagococcus acidifermentans TaxID=564710 RepID=A0A430APR1_9ENTE|nr:amidohydrolase [Vagococcus acidifermentans]RSU10118.1 peptidase M20 [Vagococcus acidifermentans]